MARKMIEEEAWGGALLEPPQVVRVSAFTELGVPLVVGGRVRAADRFEATGEEPVVSVAGGRYAFAPSRDAAKEAAFIALHKDETDRIAAVACNLRAFGVHVEEKDDGMEIEGGAKA